MRLVAKKALALLTAVSLVAPGLVGCVDFAVEQSTRARGQAATYASGYGAPPALPSFDYVPPEEPDFTSILGRPYAPAGAVKDGVSHGIVGEIPGFSHIGNDGTFNYNIPIKVPAGVRGMTPQLAISYDSRRGEGPLGVGFSLAGLSKIERCKKVPAVEEEVEPVRFENGHAAGDSYCLDGKKLMLTGGTAGYAGATYRVEVADYAEIKLEAFGSSTRFVISGADGTTRVFEPQDNLVRESWINAFFADGDDGQEGYFLPDPQEPARPLDDGLIWHLTEVRDHYGNRYQIEHDSFYNTEGIPTEWLPQRISYGDETRFINFYYAGDAGGIQRCVSGVCLASPPQLSKVEAALASQTGVSGPQWEYRLTYQDSVLTFRKQLERLEWCEAGEQCLPAKLFTWQSDTQGNRRYRKVWQGPDIAFDSNHPPSLNLLDLDGDGRDDLLYQTSTISPPAPLCTQPSQGDGLDTVRVEARLSRGLPTSSGLDAFGPAVDVTAVFQLDNLNIFPVLSRYADFDNDGADEVLAFNASADVRATGSFRYSEWDVAQNTLVAAPAGSPWNQISPEKGHVDIADVDGDGLPDAFVESANHPQQPWIFLTQPQGPALPIAGPANTGSTLNCMARPERHVMDSDGDGRHSLACGDGTTSLLGWAEAVRVNDFETAAG